MKRASIVAAVLVLSLGGLMFAQDAAQSSSSQGSSTVVNTFISSFDRGDETTKLAVINQAATQSPQDMFPVYAHALDFVVSNAAKISADSTLKQITSTTLSGLEKGGQSSVVGQLWRLFPVLTDNGLRIQTLNDIGALGKGNALSVTNLNSWVTDQAIASQAGTAVDQQVLLAGVKVLAAIGDQTSVYAFMQIVIAQVSDPITTAARQAILTITGSGDPKAILTDTISRMDASRASQAFNLVAGATEITPDVAAAIAAGTLRAELLKTPSDQKEAQGLRDFRQRLTVYLTQHPTGDAVQPLIDQFTRTVQDYDRGNVTKDRVLESIAALGASGAEPAAQRLSNYMDLLNTYTENDRHYDTQIVLAVVNNLKVLKSQSAYQPLFYATLLKYPDTVKKAASDALAALQK